MYFFLVFSIFFFLFRPFVDGAAIHVHIKPQNGCFLYRNWAHDLTVKAFRFDRVNSATATWGTNGTAVGNVGWRCGAACFKGDKHYIENNTFFDSSDDDSTAALFVMMCVRLFFVFLHLVSFFFTHSFSTVANYFFLLLLFLFRSFSIVVNFFFPQVRSNQVVGNQGRECSHSADDQRRRRHIQRVWCPARRASRQRRQRRRSRYAR